MSYNSNLQLEHIFQPIFSHHICVKNELRQSALNFAKEILLYTPESKDQETAIEHIREAVMYAEAAIDTGGITRTWDLIRKNVKEIIFRPIESQDKMVKCVLLSPKTYIFISRNYPKNWHHEDSMFLTPITIKDLLKDNKVGYFYRHALIQINKLIPDNHFLAFADDEEIPEDLSSLEPKKLFDYFQE